jgi:predicted ArsR family transcriptional regulator
MLARLESLSPKAWERYNRMRSSPDYWRNRHAPSPRAVEDERKNILRLLALWGGMAAAEIAIQRDKSVDATRGHLKVLAQRKLVQSRSKYGSGRLLIWSITDQGRRTLAKKEAK